MYSCKEDKYVFFLQKNFFSLFNNYKNKGIFLRQFFYAVNRMLLYI